MRPKSPAHDETKRKILGTARRLLLKHGHGKLSLREVARRSGFGAASLYEYFDGKDAIVAELAREAAASLRAALLRAASEAGNDQAALVALGTAYVAWAQAQPEDFMLLFQRLPSKRKTSTQPAAIESPYRVVLDTVQRAAEHGAIAATSREDVERLGYGLWATAHGMAMLQLTHLAGFDADFAAADRAVLAALVAGWGS